MSRGPSEGSGVIDAVGSGVPSHSLGLPVWLWDGTGRNNGLIQARYLIAPAEQAVPLPDGVLLDAGACLGTPAVAAMHAVLVDGGVTGKRVLAGSGICPVGHYAMQFARLAGAAQVIAAVSNACEAGVALDAGAHAVVIEGDHDLMQRIHSLTSGQGVDRVIGVDAGGHLARDCGLVGATGDIVVIHSGQKVDVSLPTQFTARKNLRMRFVDVQALSRRERWRAIHGLQAWLERGLVRHRIGARLSAERVSEAWELASSGRAGGQVLLAVT